METQLAELEVPAKVLSLAGLVWHQARCCGRWGNVAGRFNLREQEDPKGQRGKGA